MDTRNDINNQLPSNIPFKNVFDYFGSGNSAMDYLRQIPGTVKPYLDPYVQGGREAYDKLNPQFSEMASDPAAFLEKIMQGYKPSRGYQLRRDEALRAAGNTAAAGGMRGSLGDIEGESRLADSLLGEDMQDWLKNVFGIESGGLSGLTHMFDTGFGASKDLSDILSNVLGSESSLKFQQDREKAQRNADFMKAITGGIGAIGGMALPGGGSIGGALASKIFL